MRRTFLASAFLAGILTLDGLMARAQQQPPPVPRSQGTSIDLAVTYTTLGSKVTPGGNNFWLQGGSIDAAFTFHRGFGLAANITGDHASNIAPGVNLDEIDPQCDLCHVPNQAREQKVRAAISNSFGFGGNNTSLVLRAVA